MNQGYRGVAGTTSGGPPNFASLPKWVVLPNEAVLIRPGRRRGARGHVQLDEDVAHMPIDRLLAQEKRVGDGLVGLAGGDEQEHLVFPRAQAVRTRRGTDVGSR